jgi:hypothetical protein
MNGISHLSQGRRSIEEKKWIFGDNMVWVVGHALVSLKRNSQGNESSLPNLADLEIATNCRILIS